MRLIDADALLTTIEVKCPMEKDLDSFMEGVRAVFKKIYEMPTVDAVRVVRCGQCSHSEVCKMDEGDVRYCHIFEMQMEDDYYCADGERKENGEIC